MTSQRQMLIAIDFSPSSDDAVALAARLVRPDDGEVILLHVDTTTQTAPLSPDAVERRDRLRSALEELRKALGDAGVPTVALLRPGDPAREILRVADSHAPEMIVMGTHGQSPNSTPLLGSVADRVVRYSPYPVLVVPHTARRRLPVTGSAAG